MRSDMDEPTPAQEQPEEQTVTPAEVWEQLSPDIQTRVVSLIAKMAYKHVMAQRELISEKSEKGAGDVSSKVGSKDSPDLP
jgi:hypothetical protein